MVVLAEAGADTEKADGNGFTPLIAAAYQGFSAAVEILPQRRADWRKTASSFMPRLRNC